MKASDSGPLFFRAVLCSRLLLYPLQERAPQVRPKPKLRLVHRKSSPQLDHGSSFFCRGR